MSHAHGLRGASRRHGLPEIRSVAPSRGRLTPPADHSSMYCERSRSCGGTYTCNSSDVVTNSNCSPWVGASDQTSTLPPQISDARSSSSREGEVSLHVSSFTGWPLGPLL